MARRLRLRPLLDLLQRRFPDIQRDSLYAHVLCGEVYGPEGRLRDPKAHLPETLPLQIRAERFVSRAGAKLDAAVEAWDVPVARRVWLDAGASTGGFTDCLLQRHAACVHAVDVGHNVLHHRLRNDHRVIVHERTNILDITGLEPRPHAAVCDLSFRSLRGVMRHILELTDERWGIALLKPQFELAAEHRWGRDHHVPDGGVVEDPALAAEVVERVEHELLGEGVRIERRMVSPVRGRAGNLEYLLFVRAV